LNDTGLNTVSLPRQAHSTIAGLPAGPFVATVADNR
jgi:hypothetical protein